MKKVLLTLFILIPVALMAQDSVITNLQLRARTIKLIATLAKESQDTSFVKTFLAWNVEFKTNNPVDNANVTIASARTVDVANMYNYLLSLPTGLNEIEDFIGDFKTSIASFRATNSLLDGLCDILESNFTLQFNMLKSTGNNFLKLQ